ncbi:hypothetical protein [Streptomyces boninensis]|uniref:hypothetical protein n=1 Tax=Streptomyces boninensis TaxID=2039455 RepID=UPI003B22596F
MAEAASTATERHGSTLVVFEYRRMLWTRPGPGRWHPAGIWPQAAEAAEVAAHISAGHGVLVVLDGGEPTVPLLAEEFAAAPASVRRLVPEAGPHPPEPIDVPIPVLDWLPVPLRRRGFVFLRRCAELRRRTPAALLPSLLVDDPDPDRLQLRFALRIRSPGTGDSRLADTARHLFEPKLSVSCV